MSDILPCDCGHTPELIDFRLYWAVRCNNCVKFSPGQNVLFLDHIDWSGLDNDDDATSDKLTAIVSDAVEWDDLEKSAVDAWNAARTITRLRAELAEARKALQLIRSAAEQSSQWPPRRRDASLYGIEKVAIRALKSPKPPIL